MFKIWYTAWTLLSPLADTDMIKTAHFEYLVVRPTLNKMAAFDARLNTPASIALMMGTAAQESDLGYYMKQVPNGPGLGPYSIEPATHNDIVGRYLERPENEELRHIIEGMVGRNALIGNHDELVTNLSYSTAIARVRYWYVPASLPEADDLTELGKYWDNYYNANDEHGTVQEFVKSWHEFLE